jgi:hypothetical protein
MGASVSNTDSNTFQTALTNMTQGCNVENTNNQTVTCNFNFSHCDNIVAKCDNKGAQVAMCSQDAVESTAVKALSQASSKAQAALFFGVANANTSISQVVSNIVKENCGELNANTQKIADLITCLDSKNQYYESINGIDQNSKCIISAIAAQLAKGSAAAQASSAGWDPINDLMGPMKTIVIVLAIVAVVGLLIVAAAVVLHHRSGGDDSSMVMYEPPSSSLPPPELAAPAPPMGGRRYK